MSFHVTDDYLQEHVAETLNVAIIIHANQRKTLPENYVNQDDITQDKAAIETAIDKLFADQQQLDQEKVTGMENEVVTQAADIPATVVGETGSSVPDVEPVESSDPVVENSVTEEPATEVSPISVTEQVPVDPPLLTLSQVLDGYIANTDVETYQLDNAALKELKAAIEVIPPESQAVLAASILFHFKDKV